LLYCTNFSFVCLFLFPYCTTHFVVSCFLRLCLCINMKKRKEKKRKLT
jgi:hypothetical protein